jgi:hypothetical protein
VGLAEFAKATQVELAGVERSGVTRSVVQSRDREQSLEVMVRAASFGWGVGVKERNACGAQLREMRSCIMLVDSEGKVRVRVLFAPRRANPCFMASAGSK